MLDFSTREPTARSGKTCLFGAGSAGTKVMEEVLAELKDIAQRDGISCECGSHQWRLEVHYASVELICAQCGSAMRINAGTMDDLNELCCHPKLTIRSSPA